MKKQNEKYYQFSPAARKFNQANGHAASKKEVQDEIDSTIKKDKTHSCMTKKESEEFWSKFTKDEKEVIDFIDRAIVNKEFEE